MLNKITVYNRTTGEKGYVYATNPKESFDNKSYSEKELFKFKESLLAMKNTYVVDNDEEVPSDAVKLINSLKQEIQAASPENKNKTVEVLLKERGHTYGDYMTNAVLSQKIKSVMRDSENWNDLPMDMKEAFEMIATKIARALNGDYTYPDNFTDLAGYATLIADRLKKA